MPGFWRTAFDPRVSDHLISDEGEIVIDEVRRHPVAFVVPGLVALLGLVVLVTTLLVPVAIAWLPLAAGLVLVVVGGYNMLAAHMDRFVITNMRVFRVNGIFAQHTATMPMARILDISVHKPFLGRVLNYGHFVFESAAQDQGLRVIRFVARPDERDLTIQRVIQRSGLRSSMRPLGGGGFDHASPATPHGFQPVIEDASRGDGIGDDIEEDGVDEGVDDVVGVVVDPDQGRLSDEEWLAGGWSEQDASDYRTTGGHRRRRWQRNRS